MSRRSWAAASTLLIVLLSGCAAERAATPASAIPQGVAAYTEDADRPGGDRGILQGIVTDDEIVPLAGVEITLLGSPFVLLTSPEGRFEIQGLPEGPFTVLANLSGFQVGRKEATVVAGETTRVEFVLERLVAGPGNAYRVVWPKKGMLDCSWHILGWSGPCGGFDQNYIAPMPVASPIMNPNGRWNYRVNAGLTELYNEVQWQKASGASGDRLGVFLSYENRTSAHWYCSAEGKSPLRLQYIWAADAPCPKGRSNTRETPNEPPKIPADGQMVRSIVNANTCSTPLTTPQPECYAAVAAQQSFDIWFSVFYGELAPRGYTALPPS